MASFAWALEVRPGDEDEDKKRRDEIWPDMLETPRAAGIRNYNIFRHGLTLFGCFATDDLAAAQAHLKDRPVNAKWGAWMGPIMKIEVDESADFRFLLPRQFHMA